MHACQEDDKRWMHLTAEQGGMLTVLLAWRPCQLPHQHMQHAQGAQQAGKVQTSGSGRQQHGSCTFKVVLIGLASKGEADVELGSG